MRISLYQAVPFCEVNLGNPGLDGLGRSICTNWSPDEDPPPHDGVYTRLRPSKVAKGGVGVFAIARIKEGTSLFPHDNQEMVWPDKNSLKGTSKEIRNLYDDFAVIKDERYGCPPNLNRLTMSWYLNEPPKGKEPNIRCDPETYDFFATRDIAIGEELTVSYDSYSERP